MVFVTRRVLGKKSCPKSSRSAAWWLENRPQLSFALRKVTSVASSTWTNSHFLRSRISCVKSRQPRVLGPESGDLTKISVLGRQLVWTEGGIVVEADLEHARKVIHDLGLTPSSNGLDKPCVRETLKEIEQGATELDSTDATQCRSIAARVNY